MNKFRLILSVLAIVIFTGAFASISQAQATRTWTSGVGDDANPCSRTAPCKTFAGAISKTATGGEINVLDPGGFGGVTITKSITISSEGFEAGVLVSGTNAIIVNVPNATDVVVLRGLDIEGLGTGLSGITVLTGGTVEVENCTINHFTVSGINFVPTVAGSKLEVLDTIVRNNGNVGGGTGQGILVNPSTAANANLNNVRLENNVAGLRAETPVGIARVTVRNSAFTNNGTGVNARRNSRVAMTNSTLAFNAIGLFVEGNGGTGIAVLESCQIANNTGNGIQAGGGAATNPSVARISNNIINNNAGGGVSIQTNGSVESFLNNKIIGNNPDGCPGCTNISGNIN